MYRGQATPRMNLLGAEPFGVVFGKKAIRKRPKVAATSVEELRMAVDKSASTCNVSIERRGSISSRHCRFRSPYPGPFLALS